MTLRYFKNGIELENFDFGITPLGESNRIKVDIVNEYQDKVELKDPYSLDPEVSIVSFTPLIEKSGEGNMILEFKPSKERTESLKDQKVGFTVIIG